MTDTATKATATSTSKVLTTRDLGKKFNIKPTYLRRILRSMVEYNDGIHTKYSWDEQKDKKALEAIATAVHARKGGVKTDKALEAKKPAA